MVQEFIEAILASLALTLLAVGLAKVVVRYGERSIERRLGMSGIREMLLERAKLEQRLEYRRVGRGEQIGELERELSEVSRRRMKLERQLNEARVDGERVIRQIGEEAEGAPCFTAIVVNKYLDSPGFQQKDHAYIDRSWSQPQAVEVWGVRTVPEARAEIERRYPPAFGYSIARISGNDVAKGIQAKAS